MIVYCIITHISYGYFLIQRTNIQGFTLLELSIVLVIIGLLAGGGFAILIGALQASQYNATVARMAEIDKALLNFGVSHSYIPMPSLLTCTAGQVNYGQECFCFTKNTGNPSTCTANNADMLTCASYAGASNSAYGFAMGGVPTRALKLPDSYQYDAWGNRLSYAVNLPNTENPAMAGFPAFAQPLPPPAMNSGCRINYNLYNPTIDDASGNYRSYGTAAYTLISHGQNEHNCAYTFAGVGGASRKTTIMQKNGVLRSSTVTGSTPSNTYEFANCDIGTNYQTIINTKNDGTVVTTYRTTTTGGNGNFYQMLPTNNPSSLGNNFDDIVVYKEPWQIQTQGAPMQAFKTCLYAANGQANVIEIDSAGTSYLGATQSSRGAYATSYTAFDGNGNFWGSNSSQNNISKWDATGYVSLVVPTAPAGGCTSSGCPASGVNGQFSNPNGVALDNAGNLWVSDSGNNRLQQFNASGAWLQTIPAACGTGTPACAARNANGAFSNPHNLTIDTNGNIWVADTGNNRVEELSSSGAWIQNVGAAGGGVANGALASPYDVRIDTGSNVWVADYGNNRVQEFASGGTWLETIPSATTEIPVLTPSNNCSNGSSPACTASVTLGQFAGPAGLAFDPNGALWVADSNNFRLQSFIVTGTTSRYYSTYPAALACTGTSPPACQYGSSVMAAYLSGPLGITFYR